MWDRCGRVQVILLKAVPLFVILLPHELQVLSGIQCHQMKQECLLGCRFIEFYTIDRRDVLQVKSGTHSFTQTLKLIQWVVIGRAR